MHGTAFVFAGTILTRGGAVADADARAASTWRNCSTTIERRAVTDLCIVGDAFCRPIVDALDAAPERWNLAHPEGRVLLGMMWSAACKERLLRACAGRAAGRLPQQQRSERHGSLDRLAPRGQPGANFRLGKNAFVIDDANRPVAPGSGMAGRVAVRGHACRSATTATPRRPRRTFPVIDGVRCAVPGDYAVVEADGTITLLGRGSVSINTGGEKVFPEEVEECIKTMPGVSDAVVVGVPDPRFGEIVAAAVQPATGAVIVPETVSEHVRARLAGHKVPRHVMLVDSVGRGPNGKADYPQVRRRVQEWLAAQERS